MHPDILRQLAAQHTRDLMSEAAHARRAREARQPAASADSSPEAVNPAGSAPARVPPGSGIPVTPAVEAPVDALR
jgi:hypothetical protein